MKIALVNSFLGYACRGLERFTFELFSLLQEDLPVTLFGSRLNGRQNSVSLPSLKFDGFLKIFKGKTRDNYYFHQLSYALSFIPYVALKGYDLIHYSESTIGNFLYHAKKKFGLKYKLLFTNWGFVGEPCRRADHIQEITYPAYQKTLASGIDRSKVTFLPYGVQSKDYLVSYDRSKLRRQYGIPQDKIVILSVAALNRRHKRIDYLIREVARLSENYFLLVVGYPEERDLISFGQKQLVGRFKSLYFPFDAMPEVYHMADVFVLPSLIEGFCLALVEAMCAGLPVITHDSSHFAWMIEESRCLTNLEHDGNLAAKIEEVTSDYESYKRVAGQTSKRVVERFDWGHLKEDYIRLYQRVIPHASS
ncbi:MAG: glycosyltransferase family 4 protein [Candidatus Omnitrophica bacterium]|nr:glycosyltransferase family 4 protein [Candidatus Omnitrophota bacterium]